MDSKGDRGLRQGLHRRRPPTRIGPGPDEASIVVVAIHGRDQTPDYLVEHLIEPLAARLPPGVGWVLPAADDASWYDGRAADPIETNTPGLEAALALIDDLADELHEAPAVLVGFSQGGCVVAESIARRPDPWAGAVVLTGTLLGPDPAARLVTGNLDHVPVIFGLGDDDPWMPVGSAHVSAEVLGAAGAEADVVVTESSEHRIHPTDLDSVECMIGRCLPARRPTARRPRTTRPPGFDRTQE